jgi:hypothetical protein
MKSRTVSQESHSGSPRAQKAPSSLSEVDGVIRDEKNKLFLKNKMIQAEALAAVEAKGRWVDDQAHVPFNSNG